MAAPARKAQSAQRPEPGSHLRRKDLRLLPGGEMTAFVEPVVVDELGIGPLRPAPRRWIEFVGEDAHGNRDGDALDVEIPFAKIFPVETGAGKRGVRQPSNRNVVEDVVAREALGLASKDA